MTYIVAAANKKLALASRTINGSGSRVPTANGNSESPVFSSDGHYLVFHSDSTDLV